MKEKEKQNEGFSLHRRIPGIGVTALGVAAFALLSLFLLVQGDRMWRTSFRTSVPLLDSLMFARTTLSEGNLWFEELLRGNRSVEPEMVWDFYGMARDAVEGCARGECVVEGLEAEPPLDPEVHAK